MNLFLRVVGKRDDGYHLLDTVMVPISLYDEIEIKRSKGKDGNDGLQVTCDHPLVPSGKKNLVYQAARLLLKKKRVHDPVEIRIRKKIPVGAGLGGGSSDAAAALYGLNRFFGLRCKRREILSVAASLGADVPFFIYGRPARVRGVGEKVRTLVSFPRLWMVVLYPGFGVSTRWVYRNFRLTKVVENSSIFFSVGDTKDLPSLLANDLEGVTIRRFPRLALLKERLREEGAAGALMSGSGASVFGIFLSAQKAKRAFLRLHKEKGVQAYLVHSLD